jgi:hypothetical protein
MTVPRPDLELVVQLYGSCLPDYDFMLRKLEGEGRWIRFSPRVHELTARLKCQNYPELYQDEGRIQTALFRAVFENDEEIKEALIELSSTPPENQYQLLNEFLQDGIDLGQLLDDNMVHIDDLDWSPAGRARAEQDWAKLSPEEQQMAQRFLQYMLSFGLASFFNYLALMVHGRKLTQLVREAMAGNDESFCLAVHIDKSILEHIPYFKERYQLALLNGEQEFITAVNKRLQAPQLQGRIRHRMLYMLFAILEGTFWLDNLKHREILDICDRLELDRYGNRIETENALTKRLIEYRDFQKLNQKSMP